MGLSLGSFGNLDINGKGDVIAAGAQVRACVCTSVASCCFLWGGGRRPVDGWIDRRFDHTYIHAYANQNQQKQGLEQATGGVYIWNYDKARRRRDGGWKMVQVSRQTEIFGRGMFMFPFVLTLLSHTHIHVNPTRAPSRAPTWS